MKDEESHLIPVYIFDMYPYPDAEQGLGIPQKFLVLLKGTENSVVPITIGHFEGQALAMALRKIALPRPLPHDLLCNLLKRINAVVHKLVIHTLKEDVFHAYLLVQAQGQSFYLDCRPSDGMIVATLLGVPLFLTPEVMAAAGQPLDHSDQREATKGEHAAAPEADPDASAEDEAAEREGAAKKSEAFVDPQTGEPISQLEQLKAHLDWLIAQEAYEQAAKVRDRISELESQG
jgi:bifunctional DNase/RNase